MKYHRNCKQQNCFSREMTFRAHLSNAKKSTYYIPFQGKSRWKILQLQLFINFAYQVLIVHQKYQIKWQFQDRIFKSFNHCDYCHKFWILKLVGSAAVWSLIFSLYSIIHLVCVFLFNIFCRWGMPNEVDEETFFVAIQLGYAALQKVAMIVLVKIVGDSFISNLTKWATFVIASPRLLVFIEACSDIHKSIQRLHRELENRTKSLISTWYLARKLKWFHSNSWKFVFFLDKRKNFFRQKFVNLKTV